MHPRRFFWLFFLIFTLTSLPHTTAGAQSTHVIAADSPLTLPFAQSYDVASGLTAIHDQLAPFSLTQHHKEQGSYAVVFTIGMVKYNAFVMGFAPDMPQNFDSDWAQLVTITTNYSQLGYTNGVTFNHDKSTHFYTPPQLDGREKTNITFWAKADRETLSWGLGDIPGVRTIQRSTVSEVGEGLNFFVAGKAMSTYSTEFGRPSEPAISNVKVIKYVQNTGTQITQDTYAWDQGRWPITDGSKHTGARVSFYASGSSDIQVAIADRSQSDEFGYEVHLGGWSNTHSVIRKQTSTTYLDLDGNISSKHPQSTEANGIKIPKKNEYIYYVLDFIKRDATTVQVFLQYYNAQTKEYTPLLSATDFYAPVHKFTDISFRTKNGNSFLLSNLEIAPFDQVFAAQDEHQQDLKETAQALTQAAATTQEAQEAQAQTQTTLQNIQERATSAQHTITQATTQLSELKEQIPADAFYFPPTPEYEQKAYTEHLNAEHIGVSDYRIQPMHLGYPWGTQYVSTRTAIASGATSYWSQTTSNVPSGVEPFRIQFHARAATSLSICLYKDNQTERPYRIVLGSDNNTHTFVTHEGAVFPLSQNGTPLTQTPNNVSIPTPNQMVWYRLDRSNNENNTILTLSYFDATQERYIHLCETILPGILNLTGVALIGSQSGEVYSGRLGQSQYFQVFNQTERNTHDAQVNAVLTQINTTAERLQQAQTELAVAQVEQAAAQESAQQAYQEILAAQKLARTKALTILPPPPLQNAGTVQKVATAEHDLTGPAAWTSDTIKSGRFRAQFYANSSDFKIGLHNTANTLVDSSNTPAQFAYEIALTQKISVSRHNRTTLLPGFPDNSATNPCITDIGTVPVWYTLEVDRGCFVLSYYDTQTKSHKPLATVGDIQFFEHIKKFTHLSICGNVTLSNVAITSLTQSAVGSAVSSRAHTPTQSEDVSVTNVSFNWSNPTTTWSVTDESLHSGARITFRATATSNIILGLGNPAVIKSPLGYEIIIGGFDNTKSLVSRNGVPVGEVAVGIPQPGVDTKYEITLQRTKENVTIATSYWKQDGSTAELFTMTDQPEDKLELLWYDFTHVAARKSEFADNYSIHFMHVSALEGTGPAVGEKQERDARIAAEKTAEEERLKAEREAQERAIAEAQAQAEEQARQEAEAAAASAKAEAEAQAKAAEQARLKAESDAKAAEEKAAAKAAEEEQLKAQAAAAAATAAQAAEQAAQATTDSQAAQDAAKAEEEARTAQDAADAAKKARQQAEKEKAAAAKAAQAAALAEAAAAAETAAKAKAEEEARIAEKARQLLEEQKKALREAITPEYILDRGGNNSLWPEGYRVAHFTAQGGGGVTITFGKKEGTAYTADRLTLTIGSDGIKTSSGNLVASAEKYGMTNTGKEYKYWIAVKAVVKDTFTNLRILTNVAGIAEQELCITSLDYPLPEIDHYTLRPGPNTTTKYKSASENVPAFSTNSSERRPGVIARTSAAPISYTKTQSTVKRVASGRR